MSTPSPPPQPPQSPLEGALITRAATAAQTRLSGNAVTKAAGNAVFLRPDESTPIYVKMEKLQMIPSKSLVAFSATELFRSSDKLTLTGLRLSEKRRRVAGPDGASVDPNGAELPWSMFQAKNFDLLHDKVADHWQLLQRTVYDTSLEGVDAAGCLDRYARDDVFGAHKLLPDVLKKILAPLDFKATGDDGASFELSNEHTVTFCAGLKPDQVAVWARFVAHAAAVSFGAKSSEKLTIKPPWRREGLGDPADAAPLMLPRKDVEIDWLPLKQQVFDTDVKVALKSSKRKREGEDAEEEVESPDDIVAGIPHVFLFPTGAAQMTLQVYNLPVDLTTVEVDSSMITISAPTGSLKDSAPAPMTRAERQKLDKFTTQIDAPGGWTHFIISTDPAVKTAPTILKLPGETTQAIKINMGAHPTVLNATKRARVVNLVDELD